MNTGKINLRFSDFSACLTWPAAAAGVRRFRSRAAVNQYADSARLLVLGQSANVHTRAATCVVLARRRASECEENCCLVRYRIDLQFSNCSTFLGISLKKLGLEMMQ
jgi:hypothetical protein